MKFDDKYVIIHPSTPNKDLPRLLNSEIKEACTVISKPELGETADDKIYRVLHKGGQAKLEI
jgi:hypothetical protein